jgi:hypothetical protein
MIQPTIGRAVWYQPAHEPEAAPLEQPFAALVCYVHDDRTVNLSVFTPAGTQFAAQGVTLLQDDDAVPAEGRYAQWPVYQTASVAPVKGSKS